MFWEAAHCDWNDGEVTAQLNMLQQMLSKQPFIGGKSHSLADFSVAAMTTYFKVCQFPYQRYLAIDAWLGRMDKLASWRSSLHSRWK